MKQKNWIFGLIFLISACSAAGSPQTALPAPSQLPAESATSLPLTTPTAQPTAQFINPTPTDQANCTDAALFIEDVTIPDNSKIEANSPFTKTWLIKNTGTCIWNSRYTLVFSGGDRLSAPESIMFPETLPEATTKISVNLIAPAADGFYTGLFAIKNPAGKTVAIGSLASMWVKIRVGEPVVYQPPAPNTGTSSSAPTGGGIAGCEYSENAGLINQLAGLINAARADAKLPPLTVNSQLAKAAQAHSLDMACNNFLSHTGSDGSWIGDRLAAVGIGSFGYTEIIAIGSPQNALNQWLAEPTHRDAVLDPYATQFGIGYVYAANSNFGSYWTVDLLK